MERIHELEIQAAYLWALEGNTKNVLAHIEFAKEYLISAANQVSEAKVAQEENSNIDAPMKYWQHGETGRVCGTDENPGSGWAEITKAMHRQAIDN